MSKIWIIGCGDIGSRLAKEYQNEKVPTCAMVRSQARYAEISHSHQTCLTVDLDNAHASDLTSIKSNALIYYFIPPPKTGESDRRLEKFLSSLTLNKAIPKKIVLISTTGVYGNCEGEWITEKTTINPSTPRAIRRASAENILTKWTTQHCVNYLILRIPGIYAKNRLPVERIKKNLPVLFEKDSPITNRIHADDLASICKTVMESSISGETFNTTDGNPSSMTSYFDIVADYLEMKRPPKISLQEAEKVLTKSMLSYQKESRKISNTKLQKSFDIRLKYPCLLSCLKK